MVVPNGQSPHAHKAGDGIRTPEVVAFQNGFGVAGRFEAVAVLLQFFAELNVVVDLAVEDHTEVLEAKGLVGLLGQVHDFQVVVTKGGRTHARQVRAVGSAVGLGRVHRRHGGFARFRA
jgi:hypothetical protein